MHAIALRRAAALLVAAGLLLAAAPAAAAAPERPAAEAGIGPLLFDALTSWLAAFWPGPAAGAAPAPAHAARGSAWLPDGGPTGADGGPTADPERGSGADPNG